MNVSLFKYTAHKCQVKNWTFDQLLCIVPALLKDQFRKVIDMGLMQRISESRAAFISAFAGAAMTLGMGGAAATFGSAPAQAQSDNQVAAAPHGVDMRGAIIESRKGLDDHGGYLVIWYDARHQWDADGLVAALKQRGTENVVALPGRTDGKFQLIAGGKMDRTLYDIDDARSGFLGARAVSLVGSRNIAYMDFEEGAPDFAHELDRRLA